jgi:MoaA/NifB/PqqE/SkfB family radical SAM enzyme
MWRCEMILTDRCNFKCPYCRGLQHKGDMKFAEAVEILTQWADDGLKNVRFSGGEPLAWVGLSKLVGIAYDLGVERIAVSSNGSFQLGRYLGLIDYGVNDFSISLDACCASFGNKMAGVDGKWERVIDNIRELSNRVYTTVGVVLTEDNASQLADIVTFAHELGVADIRIISAAQYNVILEGAKAIPQNILDAHPILSYRVNNILNGRNVRGIEPYDSHRCYLAIDDSVVCGGYHFPCVIYMREHGQPIGKIGPNMRQDRSQWSETHDTHTDPICQKNCLDVCIDHNNCVGCLRRQYHQGAL